jgi:SnoaL-like polyketide cyclase
VDRIGDQHRPWAGVAATGKHATFSGVNIFRIRDGKVVEIWNHRDDLGLAQQLGAPIYAARRHKTIVPAHQHELVIFDSASAGSLCVSLW